MYALPVSAPYGAPYGVLPPPAASGGKKVAVIVLSVLLGVFVLAGGTLGAFYAKKSQDASNLSSQVNQLNDDNASLQRKLDAAQRDLKDSDKELTDTKTARNAIADCLNAIYDWWAALDQTNGQDTPATEQLRQAASTACNTAQPYL
jgi:outer membrane murein-binding lipoprotein Lpp